MSRWLKTIQLEPVEAVSRFLQRAVYDGGLVNNVWGDSIHRGQYPLRQRAHASLAPHYVAVTTLLFASAWQKPEPIFQ